MRQFGEYRLEAMISSLLRAGVLISCLIVVAGGILFLLKQGEVPVKYHIFLGEPKELTEIETIEKWALRGQPAALIQLGILFVIATPIFRVLLCAVTYFMRMDWVYVTISLITAFILVASFLGLFVP